jgi:hypothetical protein
MKRKGGSMIRVIVEPEYDGKALKALKKRITVLSLKVYEKTVRPIKAGDDGEVWMPPAI